MLAEKLTTNNDYQFYPTPEALAEKMLAGLKMEYVHKVLEPSAGKGNLIDALLDRQGYSGHVDVDCCEIDPQLREILKYNYGDEKIEEIHARVKELRAKGLDREANKLDNRTYSMRYSNIRVVHDDFLTYKSYGQYDLIMMNPPFAEGDKHLLKAIEMQKDGGSIICLLNAETLRNPYTNTRKVLVEKLKELEAQVEYVDNAFADAERKADVDAAIVRIYIERKVEKNSEIWEKMEKATKYDEPIDPELHALVAGDYIEQAIQLYQTEIAATLEFMRHYRGLQPYILDSLDPNDKYSHCLLEVSIRGKSDFTLESYLKLVRAKYWKALFTNEKFTSRLTTELAKKYRESVDKMADYEFSAYNIKQIMIEMNASMMDGVKKAIDDLFETLTCKYTYFDYGKNIHYFNGWKTNKAWKIGKKCIIPTWGIFSSYGWSQKAFDEWKAFEVIGDLEKAFNYLDGDSKADVDLAFILREAAYNNETKNIHCKYFSVDFFKKGTTHIKFYPETMKLVERLNIYAARDRNWLPPSYGKTTYTNMTDEEKTVVDEFHGTGKAGTGEIEYMKVLNNAAFYLTDPTQSMPALMS